MANLITPWNQIAGDAPLARIPQAAPASEAPPKVDTMAPAGGLSLAPNPMQNVVAAPPSPAQQQISHDQQRLQKIHWHQENPFGTANNHPGTLGKIAHVLSVAGNIAGDIFAPGVMANIPGTEMNMQSQEGGLAKRLNTEIGDESANESRDASTAHENAATAGLPQEEADRHALSGAQTTEANARAQQAGQPSLATAYAHAVSDALKKGIDPAQDPIVQHLSDAITSIQKQPVQKMGTKTVQLEVNGKPHQVLIDDATGKTIQDLGESGEKPPTINVNEGHKEQLALRNTVAKTYQPVMDSAERYNVMAKNYEDAVKNHDQQAMLSLLYNHMGMTMGLQKGARMTKDLIHEAQQSQPWLQGMKAHYDNQGYLSGVVLSPQQMQEMVSNARGRYSEDVVKARNESKYLGATDDGPERTPNSSVINYYIHLAGGNPQKAKQLAAQDGWSVQ